MTDKPTATNADLELDELISRSSPTVKRDRVRPPRCDFTGCLRGATDHISVLAQWTGEEIAHLLACDHHEDEMLAEAHRIDLSYNRKRDQ